MDPTEQMQLDPRLKKAYLDPVSNMLIGDPKCTCVAPPSAFSCLLSLFICQGPQVLSSIELTCNGMEDLLRADIILEYCTSKAHGVCYILTGKELAW